MPDPKIGEMLLHDYIQPPLLAGRYRLDVSTEVNVADTPLDGQKAYFDIDAPRFALAPNEVAGVFPPRNGHGSFDESLPQVALGRRTLPWERSFAAAATAFNGTPIPWMALLMFEEGECVVEVKQKIGEKLPQAVVTRLGVPGDLLVDTVTAERTLIQGLMPSYEELTLLSHVRQVNVEDRELAAGDSDGFFAVIMGNRVPQRGKKYRCCLVSIEERTDLVPVEPPPYALDPVDFGTGVIVGEFIDEFYLANENAFVRLPGTPPGPPLPKGPPGGPMGPSVPGGPIAARGFAGGIDAPGGMGIAGGFPSGGMSFDFVGSGNTVHSSIVGLTHGPRTATLGVWHPLVYRDTLVLLTTWTFECQGTASFRALMQSLDVGMIGKPHNGGPTLTDTGHQKLDMINRAGAPERVFYRGPLVPTPLSRDTNGPYHSADQARRAAPEVGAEDVSYACAFEVGRLLAAADARLAQELMRWRRNGYLRSVRTDSERFIRQWAGITGAIDPLWPIAFPFAVRTIERLVKGCGPLVDPFQLDKLTGVPGFDLNLLQQTFNLESPAQARALLGLGEGLLVSPTTPSAFQTARTETFARVVADVVGLERLADTRDRMIENVLNELDEFGGIEP